MSSSRISSSFIALAGALALVLAACGGSGAAPVSAAAGTSTSTAGAGTVSTSSTQATAVGSSTTAGGSQIPTGPGFPATTGTTFARNDAQGQAEFGLTEKEVARRITAVETLIGQCMKYNGFEYFPVDVATAQEAMSANSKPQGMKDAQFRAQYGYGISTLYGSATQQVTLSKGQKNIDYYNSLSPADKAAYDRALYGTNPQATFIVGLDSEDFSQTGGCTRWAVAQVFSPQQLGASFVNYQNAFDARVNADPRVVDAIKQWSACMNKDGYVYKTPDDITADLHTKLAAITQGKPLDQLTAAEKQQLKDLQGYELAVAAADKACDTKYVAPVVKTVTAELGGANAPGQGSGN